MLDYPADNLTADFAAWVEAQPPKAGYSYCSNTRCAFAQFLRARHPEAYVLVGSSTFFVDGKGYFLPWPVNAAVAESPSTFGALATRLATPRGWGVAE